MIQQRNIHKDYILPGKFATTTAFLAALKKVAAKGMTFYDTTLNTIRAYNGSAWVSTGLDQAMTPTTVAATTGIRTAATTVTANSTTVAVAIPVGVTMVAAISDGATKLISLPAPVVGMEIVILPSVSGFILRSSAPTSVTINAVAAGASAGVTVTAAYAVKLLCTSATTWVADSIAADGTVAKLISV